MLPKESPLTVMDPSPLSGTLVPTDDKTGPSKENAFVAVPAMPPTVIPTVPEVDSMAAARHRIVVRVDHETVRQLASPTPMVDVKSTVPKFIPNKVKVLPPLVAVFLRASERTGASKVR